MMKKTLTAALAAALLGIAGVSWAQGAAGGGAAAGGSGTSGSAGGGGASPGSSSNVPGGGAATQDATTGSSVPSLCSGMMGAERERCMNDNRGRAGVGSSQTPTHPGDAAKGDNRYNSPATGTGAHSVPGSGAGTGTRQ